MVDIIMKLLIKGRTSVKNNVIICACDGCKLKTAQESEYGATERRPSSPGLLANSSPVAFYKHTGVPERRAELRVWLSTCCLWNCVVLGRTSLVLRKFLKIGGHLLKQQREVFCLQTCGWTSATSNLRFVPFYIQIFGWMGSDGW